MKKVICCLLCISLVLSLCSCGQPDSQIVEEEENISNGTTLMIYMVGSDLEAKGGAGTNDMKEILESQVDLSCNNILIYAGGSKKWHNDNVSSESGHSILNLTENGFETLENCSEVSMGESETLTYFLNYAYENYSADNFALILWDHGNGPLIGYGKDILHDNDSLTLSEMKSALNDSPFSGNNKLSWVGFDACLMSSIELACIWKDHADYLIASQEIEPSFGWNYAFLQHLGKKDIISLSDDITSLYMESCLEYYERKDFDQRDTTLACLDLSEIDSVKNALEELFNKAAMNVEDNFSELVATRVNTRALGRASTGSEYDLIDLVDLAERMKENYPKEAESVVNATKNLIVHNVTNTSGCCGLSIYYPFYNKSYYKKSWGDLYQDLNILPAYSAYIETYAERWLQNDLLESVASSVSPSIKSDEKFVLELTNEQSKNFADANYYILQREGDEIYTRIYTSSNVIKDDNVLTANFDGNILYAKNNFDDYWIPAVDEHDTVGDYTRFSTYVNLTNTMPLYDEVPEDFVHRTEGHRFHITVNNITKEIKKSALVPFSTEVETESLNGGKLEDADLSLWSQYYFLQERHLYIQRDENGTILPLNKWKKSSYLSANVSRVEDGIEFVFAPIPNGEYYVIFEIQDVQGNKYCSELLPIQSEGASLPRDFYEEPAEVTWNSGEKVKLFDKEGISAYLTTVSNYDSTRYALQIENKNDFDVAILGDELMYNKTVSCPDSFFGYFLVPAGKTVIGNGFDFGNAEDLGMLDDLQSLQFSFSVITASGNRTLIYHKPINISLSEFSAGLRKDPPTDSWFSTSKLYKTDVAIRDLLATQQVLFEYDGLRATLLGFGGSDSSDNLRLNFRIENMSSVQKTFAFAGISFDNVFFNQPTGPISIQSGTCIYKSYILLKDELDEYQITSASSVSVYVSHMKFATLLGGGGFSEIKDYRINLSQRGQPASLKHSKKIIYCDSYIKVYLQKEETVYGSYKWTCTMTNVGDTDIMLSSSDVVLNGKSINTDDLYAPVLLPYDCKCPAGQSTVFDIKYTDESTDDVKIAFKPQFYDMAGEQLLYTGNEIVFNNSMNRKDLNHV